MGVFGVFFGCRGDAGFIGPLLWVCSGVVGFNVAMFLSPVRDVIRPALPGVWVRARKSSPCVLTMAKNWRLMARWASFSRTSSRGIPPGECVAPCAWQPDPSTGIRTQATTYRACVRIKGPARRMRSQKQKWSLTSRRRPDALYIPRERTEAAAPSELKSHAASNT